MLGSTAFLSRSSSRRPARSSCPHRRCSRCSTSGSTSSAAEPATSPSGIAALRDTIAWSYDLLGTEEKELFARLAVFGGGFTLESAVGVCDASLDGVATLIDDSLLERDGERLRMLETIREYALEQLEADEDAEFVKRRHAEHFLKVAESEPDSGQAAWLARMDAERDNFRGALAWALDMREASLGLRLASSLWEFWWVRGHLAEGRGWLDEAIAKGRTAPPELRARAPACCWKPGHPPGRLRVGGRALRGEPGALGRAGRRRRDGPLAALDRHRGRRAGRPGARDRALGARRRAVQRVRGSAGARACDQQPRGNRPRARGVCEGRQAERAGIRPVRGRSRTARAWRSCS